MEKKRVLLIDDDQKICKLIQSFLSEEFICDYINDSRGLKQTILEKEYHLVILDVELGEENGFELFPEIRKIYTGPIIFLSGLAQIECRIRGFELGADDFVTKPFDLLELKFKIERIIERVYGLSKVTCGDFYVDLIEHQAYLAGEELNLTNVPFKLLLFLIEHEGEDLSRQEIFKNIWQYEDEYSQRLVDTNVSMLRKKIGNKYIKTVRTIGYRFEVDR